MVYIEGRGLLIEHHAFPFPAPGNFVTVMICQMHEKKKLTLYFFERNAKKKSDQSGKVCGSMR